MACLESLVDNSDSAIDVYAVVGACAEIAEYGGSIVVGTVTDSEYAAMVLFAAGVYTAVVAEYVAVIVECAAVAFVVVTDVGRMVTACHEVAVLDADIAVDTADVGIALVRRVEGVPLRLLSSSAFQ